MKDIFERDMAGEPVSIDEPEYYKINEQIIKAQKISAELNCGYKTPEEVRALIAELTGTEPNETLRLIPPFQSGFGRNLRFGHQVFVNTGCFFMDRGGITIGDDVFIGPKVQLITTNHGTAPSQRRVTVSRPIVIGRNVWLGAGVIVLPGVTIGKNSVIGAGSVVLCNLPANCTAVGVPAEVVRINNKAVNPADDLDQQDLPDVMAQRLTELDRRISKLEKDAQGDVPPSIHEVIQKQQR